MVKVDIKYIRALEKSKPSKVTPSNLNPIIQCPLRALYYNSKNKAYRSWSTPAALIGNVIHLVYEDLNQCLKRGYDFTFEESWQRHELKQDPGGLRSKVKNYSVYKATVKNTVLKILRNRNESTSHFNYDSYETLAEHSLKDLQNRIEGRPDLLVLKNHLPWEIKDYKTGNIYDSDAESDLEQESKDNSNIKEDYKRQLFLYAWLVFKTYGSYPHKLALITNDGVSHPVEFNEKQVVNLIEEIKQLFLLFDNCSVNTSALAQPSEKNCKYCYYRFDCSFSVSPLPSPIGDISGNVIDINLYPYGNCGLILSDGSKVIFPKKIDNIRDILCLKDKHVTLTFLRCYYDNERPKPDTLSNFYVPTNRTEIVVMVK